MLCGGGVRLVSRPRFLAKSTQMEGGSRMISPALRARWDRLAGTNAPIAVLFLTLSGVLTSGFSVFFFGAMRPYETDGVPEDAEVTARSHWTRTVKGFPQDVYTLRYRYRDATGLGHEGSGDVHR